MPPTGEAFAARIAGLVATHPFLVAEVDGAVAGFAYAGPHSARASYRWSVTTGIYCDADHRRRGLGSALYGELLPILRRQGFAMAYAGITLPNDASVGLHERLGFTHLATYRNVGFKLGAWRDVAWMELPLRNDFTTPPAEPGPWR